MSGGWRAGAVTQSAATKHRLPQLVCAQNCGRPHDARRPSSSIPPLRSLKRTSGLGLFKQHFAPPPPPARSRAKLAQLTSTPLFIVENVSSTAHPVRFGGCGGIAPGSPFRCYSTAWVGHLQRCPATEKDKVWRIIRPG